MVNFIVYSLSSSLVLLQNDSPTPVFHGFCLLFVYLMNPFVGSFSFEPSHMYEGLKSSTVKRLLLENNCTLVG
jgi:hypothetical protein